MNINRPCVILQTLFVSIFGSASLAGAIDLPAPLQQGSKPAHAAVHPFLLHHPTLKGKIIGNRYFGYQDTFSIELPNSLENGQIEDYYMGPRTGAVVFFNDYGFFLKFEIDEVIPEVESLISQHPSIKNEILDALFSDVILVQLKESVPMLQVIDRKDVILADGEPALFAVINYPELGSIIDPATGRAFDSKRGYLLFFAQDKTMISLSLQDTLSFIPSVAQAARLSLSERLLNHLRRYQSSFRMENAPTQKRGSVEELDPKLPV